jgi:hypothetical protein
MKRFGRAGRGGGAHGCSMCMHSIPGHQLQSAQPFVYLRSTLSPICSRHTSMLLHTCSAVDTHFVLLCCCAAAVIAAVMAALLWRRRRKRRAASSGPSVRQQQARSSQR